MIWKEGDSTAMGYKSNGPWKPLQDDGHVSFSLSKYFKERCMVVILFYMHKYSLTLIF